MSCGCAGGSSNGAGTGIGLPGWTGNNDTPVTPPTAGAGGSVSLGNVVVSVKRTPWWIVLVVVVFLLYLVKDEL